MPLQHATILLSLSVLTLSACSGRIGEGKGAGSKGSSRNTTALPEDLAARAGARRLTQQEYAATVWDLLGDRAEDGKLLLPQDELMPFDNDYMAQNASQPLIEGAEALAGEVVARLMADTARRDAVIGCAPTGPDDAKCFRSFVERFGRRAYRRPLTAEEIDRFASAQAISIQTKDFLRGVALVVKAFLQDPQFLYRIEIGTPVAGAEGLFKLNGFEIAARLSYFLLGTTPTDAMLERAEKGKLETAEAAREVAKELFADPRTADRIERFHALWMGYSSLPHAPELSDAMREETDALIRRVVFEERGPWQDIFRAKETFVSSTLADHYGLPSPGANGPGWVPYGASGRRGILSHGSFLALGVSNNDSSPHQRGLAIRRRLFCQDIPPPPMNQDTTLKTETPAGEPICKWDVYAAHRQGGCVACHGLTDAIGFGLENYDKEGRYRTHDEGRPQCVVEGKGEVQGVGTFSGPGELGALLVGSGVLNGCLADHLYRFMIGRGALDDIDGRALAAIESRFGNGEFRLDDLILAVVGSQAFIHRREE